MYLTLKGRILNFWVSIELHDSSESLFMPYVIIFEIRADHGSDHIFSVCNSDHSFSGWSQHWDGSTQFWSQLALSSPALLLAASWNLSKAARPPQQRWDLFLKKSKVRSPKNVLLTICFFSCRRMMSNQKKKSRLHWATESQEESQRKMENLKMDISSFHLRWGKFSHIFFSQYFEPSFSWHWKTRLVYIEYMSTYILGHGIGMVAV